MHLVFSQFLIAQALWDVDLLSLNETRIEELDVGLYFYIMLYIWISIYTLKQYKLHTTGHELLEVGVLAMCDYDLHLLEGLEEDGTVIIRTLRLLDMELLLRSCTRKLERLRLHALGQHLLDLHLALQHEHVVVTPFTEAGVVLDVGVPLGFVKWI